MKSATASFDLNVPKPGMHWRRQRSSRNGIALGEDNSIRLEEVRSEYYSDTKDSLPSDDFDYEVTSQSLQQMNVASLSAQITAIDVLIESLNERIVQHQNFISAGGGNTAQYNQMLSKRAVLVTRLDEIYNELIKY